jgi:hypothetical protein
MTAVGDALCLGVEMGKIIAGFSSGRDDLTAEAHVDQGVRQCKRCGVRKLLDRGFYRDRTCRGGYRQVCKKCRNRERAGWALRRHVPRTGKRYLTRGDRATAASQGRRASSKINIIPRNPHKRCAI